MKGLLNAKLSHQDLVNSIYFSFTLQLLENNQTYDLTYTFAMFPYSMTIHTYMMEFGHSPLMPLSLTLF